MSTFLKRVLNGIYIPAGRWVGPVNSHQAFFLWAAQVRVVFWECGLTLGMVPTFKIWGFRGLTWVRLAREFFHSGQASVSRCDLSHATLGLALYICSPAIDQKLKSNFYIDFWTIIIDLKFAAISSSLIS